MKKQFGDDAQFTVEIAGKMKDIMMEDLKGNVKKDYNEKLPLARLFVGAGGEMTPDIINVLGYMKKFKAAVEVVQITNNYHGQNNEENNSRENGHNNGQGNGQENGHEKFHENGTNRNETDHQNEEEKGGKAGKRGKAGLTEYLKKKLKLEEDAVYTCPAFMNDMLKDRKYDFKDLENFNVKLYVKKNMPKS